MQFLSESFLNSNHDDVSGDHESLDDCEVSELGDVMTSDIDRVAGAGDVSMLARNALDASMAEGAREWGEGRMEGYWEKALLCSHGDCWGLGGSVWEVGEVWGRKGDVGEVRVDQGSGKFNRSIPGEAKMQQKLKTQIPKFYIHFCESGDSLHWTSDACE